MKSIINWFVDNPIAANLLMIVILINGFFSFKTIGREVFPLWDVDTLVISANYNGASPGEVEQQVVIRIEEAIADLDGIDKIQSTANENSAIINVEVNEGFDTQRLLTNIKTRIDALNTLPDDVDDIQVRELVARRSLMNIAVFGDVSEEILKQTVDWLQQELLLLDEVSNVEVDGARDREMTIEVSEQTLRHYGLRFDDIATAIRNTSINVPAGSIKSQTGDLQLQTRGQATSQAEFERIVITTGENNSELTLGEIAYIRDGFAEVNSRSNFNGYPAMFLQLFTSDPPQITEASIKTRALIERLKPQLPAGVDIDIWLDWSIVYESRMSLLLENTALGLVLVFIVLMLFLRPSLAGWVCVGIATAFLGTFWLLPYMGMTLNMISMYGFLLALGIVVDDAIVVGESVYFSQRRGLVGRHAAKVGALWVSKPVIFAVISTIIFFGVMFAIEGRMRAQAVPIAVVVITCLFFSLVESMLILPSHLSHAKPEKENDQQGSLAKLQRRLSRGLEYIANHYYRGFLEKSLAVNGKTLLVFVLVFGVTYSLFMAGGYLKKSFRPIIPSTRVTINAYLVEGASFEDTKKIQEQIEKAAYQLQRDEKMLAINGDNNFVKAIRATANNNHARVDVRLVAVDDRKINIFQVKDRWRELIGPLSGVKEFSMRFTIDRDRKDIRFNLTLPGNDQVQLASAVADIKRVLSGYDAIYDLEDTLEGSRTEIELRLKPYASTLGLSLGDIARQMRQGFYGEEVQRMPRGSDDIKVMLRYPLAERQSTDQIRQMYVRTNDGRSVPLVEVVDIVEVPGSTKIRRENRRRTISISANVEKGVDSLALANTIVSENLETWQDRYRGLSILFDGSVADEKEFNTQIIRSFGLAFLVSFGLMAIVFQSAWQPLLILTAIPFGFVGAVFGHFFLGITVTMNSLLGFIACAGVVVNDNLVLLDRIHQLRNEGKSIKDAITQAGSDRFRAIILTSLTTFMGLLPILSETSIQAQFLIPTVVSLAFGVLFATLVTLIFVPNLYFWGENIKLRLMEKKQIINS
jgi:multidrug efflux pump subunit AcrB